MRVDLKLEALQYLIGSMETVAVAFSGGVDSTFLVKVAYDILGDRAVAITVCSATYPEKELQAAVHFLETNGIEKRLVAANELDIPGFMDNPPNRCYLCKREIFGKIIAAAGEIGILDVIDGTNADDINDYRPGVQALAELGVRSPLCEVGMTKAEIRELSRKMGLGTWNKPSMACLASRFPYGEKISLEKLARVDKAEKFLLNIGFRQIRVRSHHDLARIEVPTLERHRFGDERLMDEVYQELKKLGFTYITLDLEGYRTGSMNEQLLQENY
jgi:uncharacterized protein